MGIPRTIGAVTATAGTPTPVYTGPVIAAESFSILNGIATVVLGGQQVTLWGFTAATYFNGRVVSVIYNNFTNGSFSFYFDHADVSSTNDAGNTAACPFQHYRAVRIECDQALSTDFIYVGDLNVSSSRYMAALSLAGQLASEVASENIPADRIFIDTSGGAGTDKVHVTLIY